ncbi:MAG: DNA polymerase III subunit delta [Saprospiraceae bacterium]
MTFDQILGDIKKQKFSPVYFLHGEEPFFIDAIADSIEENALPEDQRSFNQMVLYGKETDHLALLDQLRRYPMMSERQVVILKEAQEMKSLGELVSYLDNPMPTTVFVICHKHKKVDARTKLGKALNNKQVVAFEGKKLYDNQIAAWVSDFCKSRKRQIEPAAAALIAEYLGTELSKITNELDKLELNLPKGKGITVQDVQDNIGISKEYNVFELQKALAVRDVAKVSRIRDHFTSNPKKNPLVVTISSLFGYFSKVLMLHSLRGQPDAEILKALELRSDWFLKEYKVAAANYNFGQTVQIISLLKEYDLRSKGVDNDNTSTGEGELMKELFWKIMHHGF